MLGVQQIAVGGLNKAELANFWVTGLGIEKVGTYKSEVMKKDACSLCILSHYYS